MVFLETEKKLLSNNSWLTEITVLLNFFDLRKICILHRNNLYREYSECMMGYLLLTISSVMFTEIFKYLVIEENTL